MLRSLSYAELMEQSLSSFKTNTSRSPGTMARAILSAVNDHVDRAYKTIDQNLAMAFVSQAQGPFLDMIGEVLDCHRLDNETQENYRYRITKQVYKAAGGNEQAIRLELLQIPGVNNVKINRYTSGTGTFTVFASIQSGFNVDAVIAEMQRKIDAKQSLGIKGIVRRPTNIPVDLIVKLDFKDGVSLSTRQVIQNRVRAELINYIESRDMGQSIVINQIRQTVMNTAEEINDMRIIGFSVNSIPVLLVNQPCYWDEKFVPNSIEIF